MFAIQHIASTVSRCIEECLIDTLARGMMHFSTFARDKNSP